MPSPSRPQRVADSGRSRPARWTWIAAVALLAASMPLPASARELLTSGLNAGAKLQNGPFLLKDEPFFIFSDDTAGLMQVPKVEAFVETDRPIFNNQKAFTSRLAEDWGNLSYTGLARSDWFSRLFAPFLPP